MRNVIKRRNPNIQKERIAFKKALRKEMDSNKALAMAIMTTYASWKHKRHISEIWSLLGRNHKEAHKDYCHKLMPKHLTGYDDIWRTLHFGGCSQIKEDYYRKIPERIAMGDALSVAYQYFNIK